MIFKYVVDFIFRVLFEILLLFCNLGVFIGGVFCKVISFRKLLVMIFIFLLLVEELCVRWVFFLVFWDGFFILLLCWLFEFKFFLMFLYFLWVFLDLIKVFVCFIVLLVWELNFLLINFGIFLLLLCFCNDVGDFCMLIIGIVWEYFCIDEFWGVVWIIFWLRIELGCLVDGVKMVVVLLYLFLINLLYCWLVFILMGLMRGFFFCFLEIFLLGFVIFDLILMFECFWIFFRMFFFFFNFVCICLILFCRVLILVFNFCDCFCFECNFFLVLISCKYIYSIMLRFYLWGNI